MAVTQFERRDADALTRCMTVLEDYDLARNASGLYVVVSDSGREYLVDAEQASCECPDNRYRDVDCIHIRRVRYATGRDPIPEWVQGDRVDDQLAMHISENPEWSSES